MNEESKKNLISALIYAQAEMEPRIFRSMGTRLWEAIRIGKLRDYLAMDQPPRLQHVFEPLEEYLKRDQRICRIAALFYDEINDDFVGHTLLSPHFSQVEQRCAHYITNYVEAAAQPTRKLRQFQELLTSVVFRYKGEKSPVLLSYLPGFDHHDGPKSYSEWFCDLQGGRGFTIDMSPLDEFHNDFIRSMYDKLVDFVQEEPLSVDPEEARKKPELYIQVEEALDHLSNGIDESLFDGQRQKFLDHFQFQGSLSQGEFLRQLLWNRLLDLKWRSLYLLPARVLGNVPVGGLVIASKRPLEFEEFFLFQSLSHRIFADSALSFARLKAEKTERGEVLSQISRFFAHNLGTLVHTAKSIVSSAEKDRYALIGTLYDQVSWLAAVTKYKKAFGVMSEVSPKPVLSILLRAYFTACEMTALNFQRSSVPINVDYDTHIGANRHFLIEFVPAISDISRTDKTKQNEIKVLRVTNTFASDFHLTPNDLKELFCNCNFDEPSLDQDQVCVPSFVVSAFTEIMYNAVKRNQPITVFIRESKDREFVVIRIENPRKDVPLGEESGLAGVRYNLDDLGWSYWHTGMENAPQMCGELPDKWVDKDFFQWLVQIPRQARQ